MPKYWITPHWPHPIPDDIPWNVYLKRKNARQGQKLSIGDNVLFYECERVKGKLLKEVWKIVDGERVVVPLSVGVGGIVRLGEVTGDLQLRPASHALYEYVAGERLDWTHYVPCKQRRVSRILKLRELRELIKALASPVFTWHPMKEISPEDYKLICATFY